jgi:hypothetical protein
MPKFYGKIFTGGSQTAKFVKGFLPRKLKFPLYGIPSIKLHNYPKLNYLVGKEVFVVIPWILPTGYPDSPSLLLLLLLAPCPPRQA